MQGASSAGGGGAAEPDAPEIALLLARFACNSHTICDNELRPVGAAHVEGVQCWHCTMLSRHNLCASKAMYLCEAHKIGMLHGLRTMSR